MATRRQRIVPDRTDVVKKPRWKPSFQTTERVRAGSSARACARPNVDGDEFRRARRSNSSRDASRRRRPTVTTNPETPANPPLLARLAHLIVRRRWIAIGIWIALTLFGAFSAGQVSKRWFESFSIPGYSAYEANQRRSEE